MKLQRLLARLVGMTALAIGISANAQVVAAQCTFSHPAKPKTVSLPLVQAFVPCGGGICFGGMDNGDSCSLGCRPIPGGSPGLCLVEFDGLLYPPRSSNATALTGMPACAPPQTATQQAGDPFNGWSWDRGSGSGIVQIKSAPAKPPITPPGSADLLVAVKLKGVWDKNGPAGSETSPSVGSLRMVVRMTMWDDTIAKEMTVIDLPLRHDLPIVKGTGKLKVPVITSLLNSVLPPLPALNCANIEIISLTIHDLNGAKFATAGIFALPSPM